MQLCKFMGVTPVEGFEIGKRYEYYSAGIDAIRVLGNGMDKTFTVGDFNRSFTRIPKNNTTETETEAKRIDGYCKLKPRYVHDTKFAMGEIYPFYLSGPYTHTLRTNQGHVEISSIHFHQRFDICDIDGNLIPETIDKPEPVDMVNNPPHYKGSNGIESIDVIENFDLNFNTGNAVKYILRAGRKDITKHKEDLQKAIWYLNRELSYLD